MEVVRYQAELIQGLNDEIAVLKGNKPKPKIKPSKMENGSKDNKDKKSSKNKRPGSEKRSKTSELKVHETIIIPAKNVPKGSVFKGYKDFTVQGIKIESHNIRYRMERWDMLNGNYVEGELPPCVRGHFDAKLVGYIIYQYHQCGVTQALKSVLTLMLMIPAPAITERTVIVHTSEMIYLPGLKVRSRKAVSISLSFSGPTILIITSIRNH